MPRARRLFVDVVQSREARRDRLTDFVVSKNDTAITDRDSPQVIITTTTTTTTPSQAKNEPKPNAQPSQSIYEYCNHIIVSLFRTLSTLVPPFSNSLKPLQRLFCHFRNKTCTLCWQLRNITSPSSLLATINYHHGDSSDGHRDGHHDSHLRLCH